MKFYARLALSGALATLATAQSNATQSNDTVCYSGAYVIVARASLESQGFGIQAPIKDNITAQIPNSGAIDLQYPATIFGAISYTESQPQGVGNLTNLIRDYGDRCPDGRMILLGYSQGAHVIGDTLIGSDYGNRSAFNNTPGIEQRYVDQIASVVLFGDPAFITNQTFDVGNATRGGVFRRLNSQNWANIGMADRLVSYCDATDQFCDSGSSLYVHLGYIEEYGTQAVRFAVDTYNNYTQDNSTSPSPTEDGGDASSPSASGTPTGTGIATRFATDSATLACLMAVVFGMLVM